MGGYSLGLLKSKYMLLIKVSTLPKQANFWNLIYNIKQLDLFKLKHQTLIAIIGINETH